MPIYRGLATPCRTNSINRFRYTKKVHSIRTHERQTSTSKKIIPWCIDIWWCITIFYRIYIFTSSACFPFISCMAFQFQSTEWTVDKIIPNEWMKKRRRKKCKRIIFSVIVFAKYADEVYIFFTLSAAAPEFSFLFISIEFNILDARCTCELRIKNTFILKPRNVRREMRQ